MNVTELLLAILERPDAKKSYVEYENYLKSIGKLDEAAAFAHLVEKRFPNVSNPDTNQK